jgi:L-ascorbate metabolism protein UlaG (beta-lactamase superfamily)
MNLIPAYQKNDDLLEEINANKTQREGFRVWWLGQSGFLIQYQERHLLFDPYLSDSLTTKYANTDKPHIRMSERVIDPNMLDMIDIVTASHNHTDHLDAETLSPILRNNPKIQMVIPEANRTFVSQRLGCSINWLTGLNDNEKIEIKGFTFIGIAAAHNEIERDESGRCKYMGFVVQFGQYTLYHSGDTIWYDGLADILKKFDLDIAFLPINGNNPERKIAGNLSAEEAARLGKEIGAKVVIPHHYDMFAFNTENVQNFIDQANRYQTPYCVLKLGECLYF